MTGRGSTRRYRTGSITGVLDAKRLCQGTMPNFFHKSLTKVPLLSWANGIRVRDQRGADVEVAIPLLQRLRSFIGRLGSRKSAAFRSTSEIILRLNFCTILYSKSSSIL